MKRLGALCLWAAAWPCWSATKIACAGEHSTQSAFVADTDEYPALLQALLGADFEVVNFGYRRATVQTDGPSLYPMSTPYLQTVEFQQSLAFAPDVVVLGPFGRHDSNAQYADAGSIDRVKFTAGLKAICDAYAALPKKPRVLLALPVPYPFGAGDGVMSQVVLPATHDVAAQLQLQEVNHWDVALGHPELFLDPDHFTDAGIARMAATVRDALFFDAGTDAGADAGIDAGTPVTLPELQPTLGRARTQGCAAGPAGLGLIALLVMAGRRTRRTA